MSLDTIITNNYKNTKQVRAFFKEQVGAHFQFNVSFIAWMRVNIGKTLKDATAEWQRLDKLKKDKNYQTVIAPQFEYNRYIRDFLTDNPGKSIKDAIKFWKLKRSKAGDNKYTKADLSLTET